MDGNRRIQLLEQENDELRERITQLEKVLYQPALLPREWMLTGQEERVIGTLLARDMATKDQIMMALYAGRIDEDIMPKIVDVFICKARKKLKPFGVTIQTIWGQGWSIPADIRRQFTRAV